MAFLTSASDERSSRTIVTTFRPERARLETNGWVTTRRSSPLVMARLKMVALGARFKGRSWASLRTSVIACAAISSARARVSLPPTIRSISSSGVRRCRVNPKSYLAAITFRADASMRFSVNLPCLTALSTPRIAASISAGFKSKSAPASSARTDASSCVK